MPKRRRPRCVYSERKQRCVRDGTGNPPLCNAHRIAVVEASRPSPTAGSRLHDLVDNFMSGGQVRTEDVIGAAADLFWGMGGGMAAGYHPDIDVDFDSEAQTHQRSRFDPPPDFRPPDGWGRSAPPPPSIDLELLKARKVMGFKPKDPLNEEIVKQRRRELARKHHPDRGGSLEKMKCINDAADTLLATL